MPSHTNSTQFRLALSLLIAGFVLVFLQTRVLAQTSDQPLDSPEINIKELPVDGAGRDATVVPIFDSDWVDESYTADCAAGWGEHEWHLSLSQARSIQVQVDDCCCVGDYYEIYVDDILKGTTPQPSSWGCDAGGTLSSGAINTVLNSGTHVIKVRNKGFDGYSGTEIAYARMCPAGFTIYGSLSAPPTLPDLSVTTEELEFSASSDPYAANKIRVNATVKNVGSFDANNIELSFYRGDPAAGGRQIGSTQSLGSLSPGQRAEGSVDWILNGNVEDVTVFAEVALNGQGDRNPDDNKTKKTLSVYYVPFDHDRDAYSFVNWSISTQDIINDFLSFVDIYHPEDIAPSLVYPVVFPLFSALLEKGGHCYGMSSTSSLYYQFPEIKPVSKPTYGMTIDEARSDIQFYQQRQIPHVLDSIVMQRYGFSAKDEYARVVESIREDSVPIMLLMLSDGGAHAVTAYKIIDLGEEKHLYVYDNNLPLTSMIDATVAILNTKHNAFTYSYARYGSSTTYDQFIARPALLSPSDRADVALTQVYRWALEKLSTSGLMRIFVGSPVEPLVTDAQGRRLGVVNGAIVSEIPGAEFSEFSGKIVLDVPASASYQLSISGLDTGVMTLQFAVPKSSSEILLVNHDDVPVTSDTNASIEVDVAETDWLLEFADQPDRPPDTIETVQIHRSLLPIAAQASDCGGEKILNSSFEYGDSVGWSETSSTARSLIYSEGFPAPVVPASGTWAAWLGDINNESATLSQRINLPAEAVSATLTYKYWIYSAEGDCQYDVGWLELGDGLLRLYDMCTFGNTDGWQTDVVDLTPYLGSSHSLRFRLDTDYSISSSLFIDDVSVEVTCVE